MTREELLGRLGRQRFDLLIIGGGIVGAGIARDATMRGLKVALIEQGDFASGTSSKTSKLIHGGLRYLEQGQMRLVFEGLRERAVLRSIAPAMVRPLTLLLPIYSGASRPAWKVNVGLWLYDLLAIGRNIRPHRMLSARKAASLEPGLRIDGLRAAALYADCQMDDVRVCLTNILQAMEFGAVCGNYVRLQRFLMADGQLCGGAVEDLLTGRTFEIRARRVVNAAGPWADRVRQLSNERAPERLTLTKGIHLILPRLGHTALFTEARADQRMLFLLPWGDYTLVGTTEGAVDNSLETLGANTDEVSYLLEEVSRLLPGSHVGEDEVIATFAGARPLLSFRGASTSASREHRLEVDARGLLSLLGGKYTTYRVMARQAVDTLVRQEGWRADRCLTDQVSLLETVHPVSLDHWQALIQRVDPDALSRLLLRYGAGTFHLLRLLDRDPSLGQLLCPHHEYLQAEFVYGLRHELACTLTDVLARRLRIAWSSCQGLDAMSRMTELLRAYGECSPEAVEQQVDEYHQFLARSLGFRALAGTRQWTA